MADVLDQGDVDALLAAIGTDESDTGKGDAGASVQIFTNSDRPNRNLEIRPYDFKRPERVSKDQMRALETLHESFSRNFGAQLSGFLRTIVEVKVANIEQLTYGEFTQSLPNPTSFNLLSCEPLEGQMCLEISPLIIYPIIDRLLGGSNAELFIPQRPLTQIEQRLVSKITTRATGALSEAWDGILPIKFELRETESNPQLVQIVPPNEVVVVVGYELKMGGRAGTMSLCIPFNVIEPVMEKLSSQGWNAYKRGKADQKVRHRLADKLNAAPLVATAQLAETTITLRDLMNMAAGDIIVTEKPASSPVVLSVEGRKKFIAHLGQHKGNRALKINRAIKPNDRV
ncbi:flagellar motor switch protein FliM [Planctomycetales bacterium ZRK34]|nr:flagellar motor switch protein FliM [Planctomycetales bacterium ZRK34]